MKKLGIVEDHTTPGGRIRLRLSHVNVDCQEDGTGYTPLIIAVLNGKELQIVCQVFPSCI